MVGGRDGWINGTRGEVGIVSARVRVVLGLYRGNEQMHKYTERDGNGKIRTRLTVKSLLPGTQHVLLEPLPQLDLVEVAPLGRVGLLRLLGQEARVGLGDDAVPELQALDPGVECHHAEHALVVDLGVVAPPLDLHVHVPALGPGRGEVRGFYCAYCACCARGGGEERDG